MKNIACSAIGGGECDKTFEVESLDDLYGQAKAHAGEKHAEMVASVTPEQMEKWAADTKAVYEAA